MKKVNAVACLYLFVFRSQTKLLCRGKRLIGDFRAADDARDLADMLLFRKDLYGGVRSAVGFRLGNEEMGIRDRRDLGGMRHADDLRSLFRNLVQLDADLMRGSARNTRINFVENQGLRMLLIRKRATEREHHTGKLTARCHLGERL